MKTSLRFFASIASFAVFISAAIAADQPGGFEPVPKPPEKPAEWNVWVEVLMISVPLEKGLAILPDLRAPDKIDAAVTQLLKAVERKEATLTGWPASYTPDRSRFVVETISEQRYAAGLDRGAAPTAAAATVASNATPAAPIFATFETRNIGATLEGEPTVLPGGQSINLALVAQRVGLSGWDSLDAARIQDGKVLKLDQPQFFSLRTTTTIVLRNGERKLISLHKLAPPDQQLEFFIVQAVATPAK